MPWNGSVGSLTRVHSSPATIRGKTPWAATVHERDLLTVIDSPVALNSLTKRVGVQPDNWSINANKQPTRAIQRMRPNEK